MAVALWSRKGNYSMRQLRKLSSLILALSALSLASCTGYAPKTAHDDFMSSLRQLCGKSFAGRLVSTDVQDADMVGQMMIMHVASCTANEIRIPFHVGENRSRTWLISQQTNQLRLKHRHRHLDGSEDNSSQYGGDTFNQGSSLRQEFPADDFSKALFIRTNIPNSANNIWAIEVEAGRKFSYELRRPNRHFRVEFDLTMPVPNPPAAWGGN